MSRDIRSMQHRHHNTKEGHVVVMNEQTVNRNSSSVDVCNIVIFQVQKMYLQTAVTSAPLGLLRYALQWTA